MFSSLNQKSFFTKKKTPTIFPKQILVENQVINLGIFSEGKIS